MGTKARKARMERLILEELIYERVKLAVQDVELVMFENDLTRSIERALESCSRTVEGRDRLAGRYLRRAWRRLGEELFDVMGAGMVQVELQPAA